MLLQKLKILGSSAKWDSCGGTKKKSLLKAGVPAEYSSFIQDCASTGEKCRLMKVLLSNKCIHDCKYCKNSVGSQKKAELTPEEVAFAFASLHKGGFVDGLFLSSSVTEDPDKTADKIIESARLIREKYFFRGYIHLKVLPGVCKDKILEMSRYADRLSLNIEAPSKAYFSELCSTKDYSQDIEKRLGWLSDARSKGLLKSFTTQLVVGASVDSDLEIIERMNKLYSETSLYRTYFSAFEPVKGTAFENRPAEDPSREHRLYQCDWLIRIYGFKLDEVKKALDEKGMLAKGTDPKVLIAMKCADKYPVDVNSASFCELIKVPGIGPKAAKKIMHLRESGVKFKDIKDLRKSGAIAKRALPFIQLENSRQLRISETNI
ncbi:MAG: helix-hairpin-helix domain-containing protein [Candidatus Diapherotrites archaeon]